MLYRRRRRRASRAPAHDRQTGRQTNGQTDAQAEKAKPTRSRPRAPDIALGERGGHPQRARAQRHLPRLRARNFSERPRAPAATDLPTLDNVGRTSKYMYINVMRAPNHNDAERDYSDPSLWAGRAGVSHESDARAAR